MSNAVEVGQPYTPGVRGFPPGAEYDFRGGIHRLTLFVAADRVGLLATLGQPTVTLRLKELPDALILTFRFGQGPWGEAPYHWSFTPEAECWSPMDDRSAPECLLITVVSGTTGQVLGARELVLPADFWPELTSAIDRQRDRPCKHNEAFYHDLEELYRDLPEPAHIAEISSIGTTLSLYDV